MCEALIWLVRGMAELLGWSLFGLSGVVIFLKSVQRAME